MPSTVGMSSALSRSHFSKSRVPGNGVSVTNWANAISALLRELRRGNEGGGFVAGEPEDERAKDVDAALLEHLEAIDELFARQVEIFVDVL